MGRKAILREAVREVLVEADEPLGLSEVTSRAAQKLRKRVYPNSVLHTLESLQGSKEAQKLLSDGRPAYALTGRAFEESIADSVGNLITRDVGSGTSKFLDNGLTHESLPYVVYVTPPHDEQTIMKKIGVYHQVDWANPGEGIASLLVNDYAALDPGKQRGIAELIAWSYWCGIRYEMEGSPGVFRQKPLLPQLQDLKGFLTGTIEQAEKEGRIHDARADRAAYRVLELTEDLARKVNLQDFLSQAFESRYDVLKHQSLILKELGNYTMTGELIFDGMVKDVSKKFQLGLELAKVKTLSEGLPLHMQAADGVLNSFLGSILYQEHGFGELKGISGSLKKSIQEVRQRASYADDLVKLLKSRHVGALYVWGFPEVDSASKTRDQMNLFPSWLVALEEGRLDHRIWLFEARTFRVLREALKAVRSGQRPLPLRIDKEQWTLADVYDHYYRGREVEFWVNLINSIRDRMGPKNEEHFKAAVPPGIYSEFKKKESSSVRDMLRKEEQEVRGRLRAEKRSRGIDER